MPRRIVKVDEGVMEDRIYEGLLTVYRIYNNVSLTPKVVDYFRLLTKEMILSAELITDHIDEEM